MVISGKFINFVPNYPMINIELTINHFILESGVFSFGAGNDSQLGHGDNQVLAYWVMLSKLALRINWPGS